MSNAEKNQPGDTGQEATSKAVFRSRLEGDLDRVREEIGDINIRPPAELGIHIDPDSLRPNADLLRTISELRGASKEGHPPESS